MTLDTAYRLGQFANKLMDKAPDLYNEFEKLVREMLEESAPDKVSIPSIWDVRTLQTEDNPQWESEPLSHKDILKADVYTTPHIVADTVTSCNSECAV